VTTRDQRIREAAVVLVATANSGGDVACRERARAIQSLESLGYSTQQVVKARAHALDGFSVDEVLEVLAGEGEAVAA
jgi:hypothetical protein